MKIFWSWQSDTHQPSARHFVRDVLADLASDLNGLEGLDGMEDADRLDELEPEAGSAQSRIEVDHDTQNVGGSPPIADTVLEKIRSAAVLVADVTPVATAKSGKRVPNPNVMIELGYAVHVLGHQRIVLVMNSAEDSHLGHLPFDLRHWRWPIIYKLEKGASDERRAAVAAALKEELRHRILPGLQLAQRQMREDERRTNRRPQLLLKTNAEDGVIEITQKLLRVDVESQEDVQKGTPLLPLPDRLQATHPPVSNDISQFRRLFGPPPPVETWSRAETEGYNRMVDLYYDLHQRFLKAHDERELLLGRSFYAKIVLENSGTAPATNVDVDIVFPDYVTLFRSAEELPADPILPLPPC